MKLWLLRNSTILSNEKVSNGDNLGDDVGDNRMSKSLSPGEPRSIFRSGWMVVLFCQFFARLNVNFYHICSSPGPLRKIRKKIRFRRRMKPNSLVTGQTLNNFADMSVSLYYVRNISLSEAWSLGPRTKQCLRIPPLLQTKCSALSCRVLRDCSGIRSLTLFWEGFQVVYDRPISGICYQA